MKYGKNLSHVIELSDPEWGPFWINYKFMKKKIKEIVKTQGGKRIPDCKTCSDPDVISKCVAERVFFRLLRTELKKTSDFFSSSEQLCNIRYHCVRDGFLMLRDNTIHHDDHAWARLLTACVKFYKDVLLLENYAIMNYCGFSKILKKHDKWTGFSTCEAFMFNVMSQENFTHHPNVISLLSKSEKLFSDIQGMERCSPLQADEILFIEAIRDLNRRASRLQTEENHSMYTHAQSTSSRSTTEDNCANGGLPDLAQYKWKSSSSVNDCLPTQGMEQTDLPILSEDSATSSCSPL